MIAERGCGEQLIVGCDSDLVRRQEKLPLSGAKVLLNSPASKNRAKNSIKAMVARLAWNESAYFHVLNQQDETFIRAMEAISN
jgi:signal transduction histidine kinase